jgi:protein SCO1/2
MGPIVARFPGRLAHLALCLGLCGCVAHTSPAVFPNRQPASTPTGVGTPSLFAQPWVWRDEDDAEVRFDRWRGAPIVVTMFFTNCTSTCPLTIEKLRRVTDTFEHEGRAATFVLVTLDPSNDSPEQLRRFKTSRQLPGKWHLLRGSDEQTRELADLLQLHVLDDSHVFHDARIVVFDRDGYLAGQLHG